MKVGKPTFILVYLTLQGSSVFLKRMTVLDSMYACINT